MSIEPMDDELDLRDYLDVVSRRKWLIIVAAVVAAVVAVGLSLAQTPMYRSGVEVLLQGDDAERRLGGTDEFTDARINQNRVETEIGVIESNLLQDAVEAELGREPDVSVSAEGETDIIRISATSTEPELAAAEANLYAETYVEWKRDRTINDLLAAQQTVQAEIDSLQQEQDALEAPLAEMEGALFAAGNEGEREGIRAEMAGYEAEIQPQVTAIESQLALYRAELSSLQVSQRITRTGGAQIISSAQVPEEPFEPQPLRNGVARPRRRPDARRRARLLARDPRRSGPLPGGDGTSHGLAHHRAHPGDRRSEGGRARPGDAGGTHLPRRRGVPHVAHGGAVHRPRAAAAGRPGHECQAGRGQDHHRVEPCGHAGPGRQARDLARRRPAQAPPAPRVRLPNKVGFTSMLLDANLSAGAFHRTDVNNLVVVPSGPPPPNPSALLSLQATRQVLTLLRAECDVLVADSPPVLPVTDQMILSGWVLGAPEGGSLEPSRSAGSMPPYAVDVSKHCSVAAATGCGGISVGRRGGIA